jgi:DMSO/TMAO reductase YedYZ molybdopterin-dependent catalytic subunit
VVVSPIARGFVGRRSARALRLPPGQYETTDFPVLAVGPTPPHAADDWRFTITGAVAREVSWSWDELLALPRETPTVDIHCVTQWSKLDTTWTGVSLDTLFAAAQPDGAAFAMARSADDYETNLPLADLTGGKAWLVWEYEGEPLSAPHGGPARLLIPHLYFWKSAKWVRSLELLERDRPGYWEVNGYHDRGDPWQEQRYQGD